MRLAGPMGSGGPGSNPSSVTLGAKCVTLRMRTKILSKDNTQGEKSDLSPWGMAMAYGLLKEWLSVRAGGLTSIYSSIPG